MVFTLSVQTKSLNDITVLTTNLMNSLAENGSLSNTQQVISAFSNNLSIMKCLVQ